MEHGTTGRRARNYTNRKPTSKLASATLGTLAEAYALYCDTLTLSPETVDAYQRSVHLLLRHLPPDTPAAHISELDIQRWMRARREAGVSVNTIRSDLRRLRSGFFAWGEERGAFRVNWARLAKMPPAEETEPRSIDEETFARLIMATADTPTERRDRALLWLLWDTGARIGEIARLHREHIVILPKSRSHPEGIKEVRFSAEITKTGVERTVPFFDECASALMDYLAFDRGNHPGPLWINMHTRRPLVDTSLKHIVRKIGEYAGVAVGAHDFRRALVERLQSMDPPMPDTLIQQITGHRSLAMVARYGRRKASENARDEYRRRMSR